MPFLRRYRIDDTDRSWSSGCLAALFLAWALTLMLAALVFLLFVPDEGLAAQFFKWALFFYALYLITENFLP